MLMKLLILHIINIFIIIWLDLKFPNHSEANILVSSQA